MFLFPLLYIFPSFIVGALYSALLISQWQVEKTWSENMGCVHGSTITLTLVPQFLNLSKSQGPDW